MEKQWLKQSFKISASTSEKNIPRFDFIQNIYKNKYKKWSLINGVIHKFLLFHNTKW